MTYPLYLPAFVSQRRTALAADGIDDCRVIAAQALAAGASEGETQRNARGNEMNEMSVTQLTQQAVKMRRNLDRDEQTGPLNTSHTTRMIELMWPQFPLLTPDDISFGQLLERLLDGYCASLSGNPGHIKGDSPLKRAGNVGHEFYLGKARKKSGDIDVLVYDPYRVADKVKRGEWRPANEVRQFAYKDSDRDLTAVFTERKGSLTAESLKARKLNARHARAESEIRARNAQLQRALDACRANDPQCDPAINAAVNETIGSIVQHAESLRR